MDTFERVLLRDVVDEKNSHGISIMCGGDGAETLLAGCVKELKLNSLAIKLYSAKFEVDTATSATHNCYYTQLWEYR